MFTKLHVGQIIVDHLKTFRSHESQKTSISDFVIFLGLPLAAGILLALFRPSLAPSLVEILVTSMSVFTALLFNLMLLIYELTSRKFDVSDPLEKLKRTLLVEVYSNVSFSVLVAIVTLIALLVNYLEFSRLALYESVLAGVVYFLVLVFLFTLFMILRRIHILLRREVASSHSKRGSPT